jgi:hypothetical protein
MSEPEIRGPPNSRTGSIPGNGHGVNGTGVNGTGVNGTGVNGDPLHVILSRLLARGGSPSSSDESSVDDRSTDELSTDDDEPYPNDPYPYPRYPDEPPLGRHRIRRLSSTDLRATVDSRRYPFRRYSTGMGERQGVETRRPGLSGPFTRDHLEPTSRRHRVMSLPPPNRWWRRSTRSRDYCMLCDDFACRGCPYPVGPPRFAYQGAPHAALTITLWGDFASMRETLWSRTHGCRPRVPNCC